MSTLEFKGKSFVYAHHLSVPFRELVIDADKSLPVKGEKPSLEDNLIIHGDNLHALKALLPVYAGKVDCIYIDPPYNTGSEGWCYNDNVRSPLMREWLKQASPVDKEDLERHDKWLCMMWPRLKLLHDLLAEDGVIFVSIDDNEVHRLRVLMDDIFGEENFVESFIWKKSYGGGAKEKHAVSQHEYILMYAMHKENLWDLWLPPDEDAESRYYKYKDEKLLTRGPYRLKPLEATKSMDARANLIFPINGPSGVEIMPKRQWWWSRKRVERALANDELVFTQSNSGYTVSYKQYLINENGEKRGAKPFSIIDGIYNQHGSETLVQVMSSNNPFNFPKPYELIVRLLLIHGGKKSLILDSFAGSGTTAHAVLALNKKDGGNRKFILVETEDYADKLTAERVRRVINGYQFEGTQREELLREPLTWNKLLKADKLIEKVESIEQFEGNGFDKITKTIDDKTLVVTGEKKITEKVKGLGGSFTFVELGPEISLDKLLTDGLPTFESLAKYVFFTATGRTLMDVPNPTVGSFGFIGETDEFRVHLHYQPDKAWLQSNESALTEDMIDGFVATNTNKKRLLVFAAAKFMSQRELSKLNVEYCQLPYAIHRIFGD